MCIFIQYTFNHSMIGLWSKASRIERPQTCLLYVVASNLVRGNC